MGIVVVVFVVIVVVVIMKVLVVSLLLLITVSCFEARGYRRANSRRRGGKKLDPEVQKVITDIWNNDHNRAEYGKISNFATKGTLRRETRGTKLLVHLSVSSMKNYCRDRHTKPSTLSSTTTTE